VVNQLEYPGETLTLFRTECHSSRQDISTTDSRTTRVARQNWRCRWRRWRRHWNYSRVRVRINWWTTVQSVTALSVHTQAQKYCVYRLYKNYSQHNLTMFNVTFWSPSETFVKRSLFSSSSGSCHGSDATWLDRFTWFPQTAYCLLLAYPSLLCNFFSVLYFLVVVIRAVD